MGRYLDLAQRALEEMGGGPQQSEHTDDAHAVSRRRSEDAYALRSRLAGLRQRLDKGFEVLRAREEANNTTHPYPLWLQTWGKLLREYEVTVNRLADLTRCRVADCGRLEGYASRPTDRPEVVQEQEG